MYKYIQLITACCVLAFSMLYAQTGACEILTVPYRGAGSMQTAATTIEFEPSSFSAGAHVTVEGVNVSVPASPCSGVACKQSGITPGGDAIQVERISGTNQARLTLSYIGSFNGNYCSYSGNNTAKTFDISLSGFNFATPAPQYRITSYMAPSHASCDHPYARVPTVRPSFPAAGTWTKLGRLPLNVVLVLDKSGSMTWTIPGSSDIRWDRMSSSVNLFASVWDALGAPPPPASESSEGDPRDRLGLVFFSDNAVEHPLDGASFFKQRGASTSPWSAEIASALSSEPVGGGTSLGSGLIDARARLNDVHSTLGDSAIVLFTDGEQNLPPCVIREGKVITPTNVNYPNSTLTYTDECATSGTAASPTSLEISGNSLVNSISPRGPIYTIGLGEGGMAASAQLLDEISRETAGIAWFPNNGVAMDSSFVDSLVENLKGGTVSLLDRAENTIPAQTQAGTPIKFSVDPSVTRVVYVLSWEGSSGQEVSLQLKRPDGTSATPSMQSSGTNFKVVGFNMKPAEAGDWTAQVTRYSNIPRPASNVSVPSGSAGAPFTYQLSAYSVESRFNSHVTESQSLGTGKPIKITADVGWGSKPLESLPKGSVRAFIEKPGENLGTILYQAAYPKKFDVAKGSTPLATKIEYLVKDKNLLGRIKLQPLATGITLTNVGNGRYQGSFNGTNIGGTYRIRVEFNWNDTKNGKIHRIEYAERQVPVVPSLKDSVITKILDKEGRLATLQLTLKDAFGNYVGPGFSSGFQVLVNGKPSTAAISDPNVKGVYTISDPKFLISADPKIQISFDNHVVAGGKLSVLGSGATGGTGACQWYDLSCGPKLLKYIILAIIILLILFLLFKKR